MEGGGRVGGVLERWTYFYLSVFPIPFYSYNSNALFILHSIFIFFSFHLYSLSGGDAFQRARDLGSLTEDEVRLYTKQVCEGLLHIHKEGYMHLNMKVRYL